MVRYGGARFTDPAMRSSPILFRQRHCIARIAELHPDAVILSGDLPYDGSMSSYGGFRSRRTAPPGGTRSTHLPHSAITNCTKRRRANRATGGRPFRSSKDARWYSVAFASCVIALDSDLPLTEGSRPHSGLRILHKERDTSFSASSASATSIRLKGEASSHNVRPTKDARLLHERAPRLVPSFIVITGHGAKHNYRASSLRNSITYLVIS